tara:strand:- start:82 stop:198 length:117 start_codon:yes stop_codon:yes gene_type:complete
MPDGTTQEAIVIEEDPHYSTKDKWLKLIKKIFLPNNKM